MLFSSPVFLFWFLPITLAIYFVLPTRGLRNLWLAFASVFFYAWGEPVFVFVMLASVGVSYVSAIIIERLDGCAARRRAVLVFVVLWHMSIFFVFKYWDFFFGNLARFLPDVPMLGISLPIGISFFTFQSISYVLDVYMSPLTTPAQRNFFDVLLYISMFPQLVAGPIVRYHTIADEIKNRRETFDDFGAGVYRFLCGLVKKVLIANNMAIVADLAFNQNPSDIGAAFAWLGAVAYFFQIYYDFSGYSDMAIGLGRMLGFHFLENFRFPYISRSMTEVWSRWHISLGSWFKDYLYIPMGGSRYGRFLTARNLFVVWLFTGIWHGASWNFVVWGMFNFFFVLVEKVVISVNSRQNNRGASVWQMLAANVYTAAVLIIGWVVFRSESLGYALRYIGEMLSMAPSVIAGTAGFYLREYGVFFVAAALFSTPLVPSLERRMSDKYRAVYYIARNVFVTACSYIAVVYLIKGVYNPFIYFNF